MYWTEKHVLICTASHCAQKGANDVAGKLRLDMVRKGLDKRILVNTCGTIDLCDCGPNLVVYPDNIIYSGVTVKDIPEIIQHLTGGPVVERLVLGPESPDEQRRHACYAEACSQPEPMPADQFREIAARHGFDETWIGEQLHRGFIARRTGEAGEAYIVTSKGRTRYGLPS